MEQRRLRSVDTKRNDDCGRIPRLLLHASVESHAKIHTLLTPLKLLHERKVKNGRESQSANFRTTDGFHYYLKFLITCRDILPILAI